MALNFPNSPTIGQVYVANNVEYTWTGYLWESSTAAGSKGDKGDIGPKGEDGAIGPKGDKGDLGTSGVKGEKGEAGTAAAKGDKGDKGEKGFVGTQGVKGDKGERVTVWKGSAPPTDTNLLWFNTVDGNFLVYYDDGDTPYWVDASPTVVGDKGDKGQKGDTVVTLENATVSNTFISNNVSANSISTGSISGTTATFDILNANVANLPSLSVRVFDSLTPLFDNQRTVFPLRVNGANVTLTAAEQLLVNLGGVIVEPDYNQVNDDLVFSLPYIINTFVKGYRIDIANNSIEFATAPLQGQPFAARTLSQTQSFASTVAPPDYIDPLAIILD